MDGAKGSALEWALALLHAPGERHVLRQKPLPQEGMDLLLGIAAEASSDALAEQAARFGETEAQVLEAARFYAREVLFHPQADAYRILGVEPGASGERIKAHYRLLQLWLHPDRAGSKDDAVFATRVNAAWNRLRSPERRQAYDEALRRERPPELFDSSGALRSVRAWVPAAEPIEPASPWRRRLPVLVLLALCGVLVLLALRDLDRPSEQWEDGTASAPPAVEAGEFAGLSIPGKPAAAATRPAAAPHPGASKGAAAQSQAKPTPSPTSARPARPAVAVFPAGAPLGATTKSQPAEPASTTSQSTVTPRVDASSDAASRLQSKLESPPADMASTPPAGVVLAAMASGAAVEPGAASPVKIAQAPPDFARIQSARQVGDQLLRYLRTPRAAPPPIWNSPAVAADADRLRQQLHGGDRARLADAQWRIGSEEARLASAVAWPGPPAGTGRLIANLRWRDGRWLVTEVGMERMQ